MFHVEQDHCQDRPTAASAKLIVRTVTSLDDVADSPGQHHAIIVAAGAGADLVREVTGKVPVELDEVLESLK